MKLVVDMHQRSENWKKSMVEGWLFDEDQGNIAKYPSENSNDGKLENSPKWNCNGKFGQALEFDGNQKNYIEVGNLEISGSVTLTL